MKQKPNPSPTHNPIQMPSSQSCFPDKMNYLTIPIKFSRSLFVKVYLNKVKNHRTTLQCQLRNEHMQAMDISMFIPHSTLVALHRMWNEHGNVQIPKVVVIWLSLGFHSFTKSYWASSTNVLSFNGNWSLPLSFISLHLSALLPATSIMYNGSL